MSADMGICTGCGIKRRLTPDGLVYTHKNCKGSKKPSREMQDRREFDSLVKSQKAEPVEIESLWDGVKVLWGPLHGDEGYLVKGVIMVECVDTTGRPNFMWVSSPYMSTWDIKGMLGQVQEDLTADSLIDSVFKAIADSQMADDEEEDEDEQ